MSRAPTGKVIGSMFTLLVLGGIGLPTLGTSWDSMVPQEISISGTVTKNSEAELSAIVWLYRVDGGFQRLKADTTFRDGSFSFDLSEFTDLFPLSGDYLVELAQTSIPEWHVQRRVTVVNQSREVDFKFDSVWVFVENPPDSEYPRLRVDKNPLYVVPGHTIQWVVGELTEDENTGEEVLSQLLYPLTVHFPSMSPLLYRRQMAEETGSILGQVRARILPGKYSYFVAVFDTVAKVILTEDPEIIDENGDDPGGGNGGA